MERYNPAPGTRVKVKCHNNKNIITYKRLLDEDDKEIETIVLFNRGENAHSIIVEVPKEIESHWIIKHDEWPDIRQEYIGRRAWDIDTDVIYPIDTIEPNKTKVYKPGDMVYVYANNTGIRENLNNIDQSKDIVIKTIILAKNKNVSSDGNNIQDYIIQFPNEIGPGWRIYNFNSKSFSVFDILNEEEFNKLESLGPVKGWYVRGNSINGLVNPPLIKKSKCNVCLNKMLMNFASL